jgi:hypothetical protein
MTFAPESCTVSDDGRLVTCQAVDLPVTLDAYSDFIDDEWVVVDAETREVGWVLVEMVQVSRLNAAGTVFEGFEFTLDTTNEDFDRSTTRYFFAGGEGLWGSCNNDPSTWTFHGQ